MIEPLFLAEIICLTALYRIRLTNKRDGYGPTISSKFPRDWDKISIKMINTCSAPSKQKYHVYNTDFNESDGRIQKEAKYEKNLYDFRINDCNCNKKLKRIKFVFLFVISHFNWWHVRGRNDEMSTERNEN